MIAEYSMFDDDNWRLPPLDDEVSLSSESNPLRRPRHDSSVKSRRCAKHSADDRRLPLEGSENDDSSVGKITQDENDDICTVIDARALQVDADARAIHPQLKPAHTGVTAPVQYDFSNNSIDNPVHAFYYAHMKSQIQLEIQAYFQSKLRTSLCNYVDTTKLTQFYIYKT